MCENTPYHHTSRHEYHTSRHKHIISFENIYTGVYLDTSLRIIEIHAIIHIHSGTPYVRRLRLRLYIYDRIRRDRRRTRRRLCTGHTRLSGYGV